MSRTTLDAADAGHDAFGAAPASTSAAVFTRIKTALAVRRQRRALMALDSRMLADIGLSEADAWREANRSIFDHAVPGAGRR